MAGLSLEHTKPLLLGVIGPTAAGKTAVGLALAHKLGAPILSADSRQVYRMLDIATAKPSVAERAGIPHEGLDWVDPQDDFSAGDYARRARAVLETWFQEHPIVLLVGGTGFYIQALVAGLPDLPRAAPELREELRRQSQTPSGLEALLAELQKKDPAAYAHIDRNNPVRITRALEVIRSSGRPFSSFKPQPAPNTWRWRALGVSPERAELHQRINHRTHNMLERGLLNEVDALAAAGYTAADPGLRTIGYREVFAHRRGELASHAELEEHIAAHTRQYARRQLTWFRRNPPETWVHPQDWAKLLPLVEQMR